MIIKINAEQVVPGSPGACSCHDPSTLDSGCTVTLCHLTRGLCIEGRTSSHAFGLFCRMFALADAFPVHYVPAPGPRSGHGARISALSRALANCVTEHRQVVGLAARHEDVRARGAA